MADVLVKNAKGRYVFCDPESAAALVARSGKGKGGEPLARIVEAGSDEHAKGSELAAGGQEEGVRGGKLLVRTGEGLIQKEG